MRVSEHLCLQWPTTVSLSLFFFFCALRSTTPISVTDYPCLLLSLADQAGLVEKQKHRFLNEYSLLKALQCSSDYFVFVFLFSSAWRAIHFHTSSFLPLNGSLISDMGSFVFSSFSLSSCWKQIKGVFIMFIWYPILSFFFPFERWWWCCCCKLRRCHEGNSGQAFSVALENQTREGTPFSFKTVSSLWDLSPRLPPFFFLCFCTLIACTVNAVTIVFIVVFFCWRVLPLVTLNTLFA